MDIIIPTKNDRRTLRDCLESLKNQTIPCRVIIVDGNSTDKTIEIAEEYGCEIYTEPVTPNVRRSAEARNLGLKYSTSRLVGFVDADTILPPTWAEDLSKYIGKWTPLSFAEMFEVVGVTSGCEWKGGSEKSYAIHKVLQVGSTHGKSFDKVRKLDSIPTYNAIYLRGALDDVRVFFDIKGKTEKGFLVNQSIRPMIFDETIGGCEDWELNRRLRQKGWVLLGIPQSPVEHRERPTLESFARQMFHYAWARGRLTKTKKILTPLYSLPSLALLFLVFSWWFLPYWVTPLLLGWYLVLLTFLTVVVHSSPLTFMVFFVHHTSWALGYLWGLLS